MKEIKNNHTEKKNVIPFLNTFCHISPIDSEDIMEWLDDKGYLSEKGKTFRHIFLEMFIKNQVSKNLPKDAFSEDTYTVC